MKLLDEIIESAISNKEPVADTLRRCLVLAYRLNNEAFKKWIEQELNGYAYGDELPEHRKAIGTAHGHFLGPFNSQISNQPLAPAVMNPEHRHWARNISLYQPIAAYEVSGTKDAQLDWPADVVLYYQSKFIDGMALNRAWIDIPASLIVGTLDTIRTRILKFALEIQASLPSDESNSVDAIPTAKVDRLVQVIIYGGNNVIGQVEQFSPLVVIAGDLESLDKQLKTLGLTSSDMDDLHGSIEADRAETEDGKQAEIGSSTMKWIKNAAKKAAGGAAKISGVVAEEVIKASIMKYLGL